MSYLHGGNLLGQVHYEYIRTLSQKFDKLGWLKLCLLRLNFCAKLRPLVELGHEVVVLGDVRFHGAFAEFLLAVLVRYKLLNN
jgi:hypothetical protein